MFFESIYFSSWIRAVVTSDIKSAVSAVVRNWLTSKETLKCLWLIYSNIKWFCGTTRRLNLVIVSYVITLLLFYLRIVFLYYYWQYHECLPKYYRVHQAEKMKRIYQYTKGISIKRIIFADRYLGNSTFYYKNCVFIAYWCV